jgi:hypothetical protein
MFLMFWSRGGGIMGGLMSKRDIVNGLKNRPCMDCGGWFDPWQMDFDHREDKRRSVGAMVSGDCSIEAILAEIKKCDLVCANCHRTRTHKQRQAGIRISKALPVKSVKCFAHTRWLERELAKYGYAYQPGVA